MRSVFQKAVKTGVAASAILVLSMSFEAAAAPPNYAYMQSAPLSSPMECTNYQGYTVRFKPTAYTGAFAHAVAYAENGDSKRPAVRVNLPNLTYTPVAFQQWIYAHECAHHVLGHIDGGKDTNAEYRQEERNADCYAIKWLARTEGYGQSELDVIGATMKATYAGDEQYDAPAKRVADMAQCLAQEQGELRQAHNTKDRRMAPPAVVVALP